MAHADRRLKDRLLSTRMLRIAMISIVLTWGSITQSAYVNGFSVTSGSREVVAALRRSAVTLGPRQSRYDQPCPLFIRGCKGNHTNQGRPSRVFMSGSWLRSPAASRVSFFTFSRISGFLSRWYTVCASRREPVSLPANGIVRPLLRQTRRMLRRVTKSSLRWRETRCEA